MAKKEALTPEILPAGETGMVTAEEASLTSVPDFIPQGIATGAEGITKEDIQMPRLAIAQALSPAKIEGKPEYIEGLKLGDLYNTLNSEIYGKGPLEFAIVQVQRPRWVEFDKDRNMIDPDVPANDNRTLWRSDPTDPKKRLPPIATQFYDYIAVLLDTLTPVVISCARTNVGAAKKLNGLIALRMPKVPIYARRFMVSTAMQTNDKGTWGQFVFNNVGDPRVPNSDLIRDKATFDYLKSMAESLQDVVVHYDIEAAPETGDASFDTAEMDKQPRPGGM